MVNVQGLTVEQVDRMSEEFEALVAREMTQVADAAARHLGDRMEARASTATVSQGDINVMFRMWEESVERLLPALESIWLDSANHELRAMEDVLPLLAAVDMPDATNDPGAVAPPPPPRLPNPFVRGAEAAVTFLSKAKNRLRGIGNELWANARISLTAGMEAGESIPRLAARVQQSAGVSQPRANVIARTEVVGASNAGSIRAMRSVQNVVQRKTWLATLDDRTREDHLLADGQTVDMGAKFVMDDGSELDHPGDPFGAPQQVINCRCTMTYEVEMPPLPGRETLAAAAKHTIPAWEALTAAAGERTGMVALRPADPSEFAVAGGDPAEELHVTLCFLGKEVTDQIQSAATEAAEATAESVAGTFTATVAGYGVLGSEDAVVLFLNGDGIAEAHETLHQALGGTEGGEGVPSQFAPWIPHMTLGYGIDVETAKAFVGHEFEIDAITVDVGDEQVGRYEFGGAAASLRSDGAYQAEGQDMPEIEGAVARWRGVMVVEDTPTGDGRQFAADALTWPDMPLPLQWQKETSHGGFNDVTVTVGTIDTITREGSELIGEGVIDLGSEDGREVFRRINELGLGGVSIVADDPEQAEVEYQYPEGCADLDELSPEELDDIPLEDLNRCLMPELVIFHSGRVRALTVVDTPAFVEAKIEIVEEAEVTAAAAEPMPVQLTVGGKTYDIGEIASPDELAGFLVKAGQTVTQQMTSLTVVSPHETDTTDEPWDGAQAEARLPSPMSVETAQGAYAWYNSEQIDDGEMPKSAGRFIHHEVSTDGTPGAANVAACQTGIGVLNGARGVDPAEQDWGDDREGIYAHLAAHLRDADIEPPELLDEPEQASAEPPADLVAAAWTVTIPDVPSIDWYSEPTELPPIGAINVTEEGRFYGLLAPRGVAHRGYADKRIEVPMGNVDYSRFMSRPTPVAMADGTVEKIPAGVVTMNCGHAKTHPSVGTEEAMSHYDNSCSIAATVRIGENSKGVWVAGALTAGFDAKDLARVLGCQLSGDWRPHGENAGMRELTAALLVPVPGFASSGPSVRLDEGQLVAASAPIRLQGQVEPVAASAEAQEKEIKSFATGDAEEPTVTENDTTENVADATTTGDTSKAGVVEDLPDFETALQANDPKAQLAEMQRELGLDPQSKLAELVASVRSDEG